MYQQHHRQILSAQAVPTLVIHLLFAVVLGPKQNGGIGGNNSDLEHFRIEYTGILEGVHGYGIRSVKMLLSHGEPSSPPPPPPLFHLSSSSPPPPSFNYCPT